MYHYLGCELPNAWLKNGYELAKTKYGDGVVIHEIEALHDAIGRAIIASELPLSGDEVRFLRLELNLSQTMLAPILGKEARAVRRWENGKSKVDGSADRLLRVLYERAKVGKKELEPMLAMLQRIALKPRDDRKLKVVAETKKKACSATTRSVAASRRRG